MILNVIFVCSSRIIFDDVFIALHIACFVSEGVKMVAMYYAALCALAADNEIHKYPK